MSAGIRRRSVGEAVGAVIVVGICGFGSAAGLSGQEADLEGIGHDLGDPDAPVLVVEYADFACGACAQFAVDTWPRIRVEFVKTGKVRWKVVPFELGFRNSDEGARAGECGAAQGGFWALHDVLYEHRSEWVEERNPEDALARLASRAGLDEERFRECYDDEPFDDRTRAANRAARADRVRGTPTFFVNGFQVQGALPFDAFRLVLEEAIAKRDPLWSPFERDQVAPGFLHRLSERALLLQRARQKQPTLEGGHHERR